MARIRPRNWSSFQHYKDRDPTWIKLHKKLLDDFEFQCLPVASRALAPMLWLIASEDKDGWIDADERKLSFRLRADLPELRLALKALIEARFFELENADSALLAETERVDSPEKEKNKRQVQTQVETEDKRARRALSKLPEDCPTTEEQEEARKYWLERNRQDLVIRLADEVAAFRAHHEAYGKRMADWSAAWRTWRGNAMKFNRATQPSPSTFSQPFVDLSKVTLS